MSNAPFTFDLGDGVLRTATIPLIPDIYRLHAAWVDEPEQRGAVVYAAVGLAWPAGELGLPKGRARLRHYGGDALSFGDEFADSLLRHGIKPTTQALAKVGVDLVVWMLGQIPSPDEVKSAAGNTKAQAVRSTDPGSASA